METRIETEQAVWSVPQCAFRIEYSPRVLDDIRLAIVEAFFSLPRGGAEIGGVLLGRHEGNRVVISGFVDLECEHAKGPSFVLSARDHSRLAELLASARGNSADQPVGWYHSHTRSDIFLSAEDLEIHKRYFPEPWQIALVLKPHTFQPTRAGFFFQGTDGIIRSTASYREFAVEPLSAQASSITTPARDEAPPAAVLHEDKLDVPPEEPRAPVLIEPPVSRSSDDAAPLPAGATPARSRRKAVVLLIVTLGLAATAAAIRTRELWLPRLESAPPSSKDLFVGLNTLDRDGQLIIRWDRQSAAVQQAALANLMIEDAGLTVPKAVELDPAALKTGTFTYGRKGERVDVAITLHLPDGRRVREVTTYLGQAPASKPSAEDPGVPNKRDVLDEQLKASKARNRNLQKSVEEMRQELRREQRRRLGNQSPDTAK